MSVEIEETQGEVTRWTELTLGQVFEIKMPEQTCLGTLQIIGDGNGFIVRRPIVDSRTRYEAGTHASSLTIRYKNGNIMKISALESKV